MNELVLNAISQMGKLPYGSSNVGGLKELEYRGTTILRKGTASICCSAVYEVLWRTLEARGLLNSLGIYLLDKLKDWVWVAGDENPENPYYTGVAGGIVEMGLGKWVCRDLYVSSFYEHSSLGDPSLFEPGDFAQFYDYDSDGNKTFGHSIVVVGHTVSSSGAPAIECYSSDPSLNYGHGYDYWSIDHPTSSKSRVWFGARLF